MEFEAKFFEWAFYLFISGIGMYIAKSIGEMNRKLAILLEKSVWHEKEMDETKDRVLHLEKFYFKNKLN